MWRASTSMMTGPRVDDVFVGVDVGGTKVLAGVVGPDGEVQGATRRATPDHRNEGRRDAARLVEDALVSAVRETARGRRVTALGVGAAGFVDATGERVMFAPHLPWRDDPVRQRLAERLGCRVVLENDATCAALAELVHGAARGADSALMVTLGTGIGGGVVVGGRVLRGAHGMAGEFGHMQVVPDGRECECGRRGCWEQYCSGNALVRHARDRIGDEATVLAQACHGDPEALTGPMVTRAAEQADPVAREAFRTVGDWLGVGVANLVAAFDPQLVVVGGGLSAAGEQLLGPARHALARSLVGAPHRDAAGLVGALLGPEAGMIGAATLARDAEAQRLP